jgi:hypothetical protein
MSIPQLLACMLVVPLAGSALIPTAQGKASDPVPSCNLGDPRPTAVRFTRLHHKQFSNKRLRKREDYKEAGKPGHDPIILRIAPYDIDWA